MYKNVYILNESDSYKALFRIFNLLTELFREDIYELTRAAGRVCTELFEHDGIEESLLLGLFILKYSDFSWVEPRPSGLSCG